MIRRTLLLLATLALLIPVNFAFADDYHPGLALGIQGGMSFSDMSTPGDVSSVSRTGFMAGINVDLPLWQFVHIQPELSFVQRGSTLTNVAGLRVDAFSDAIEVPVLLKFVAGEKVRPYAFVGPNFIFNVSNQLTAQAGGQVQGIGYNPRTFDTALDFGAGLEIGPFFTNLRYSLGLLDVNDNSASWRSRGFQLLVGLKFG